MIDEAAGEVRYEVLLAASRAEVWPLIAEARRLTEWIYDAQGVELEPRVGGRFHIAFSDGAFDGEVVVY